MIWSVLAIISAVLLGLYDVLKKGSLRGNFVLPVLFMSAVAGALLFIPIIFCSRFIDGFDKVTLLYVPQTDATTQGLIFLKSVLVASSWILAYFAMKHLPITIASPIRASAPLWTLLGALLLFRERLNWLQWAGVSVTIIFYYIFSLVGRQEGIDFRSNRWVLYMVLATILGSISALYDKFLIQHYDRMAVQAWYSVYLVPVIGLVLSLSKYSGKSTFLPFRWSWTIPMIGITLSIADFLYFFALACPGSLIAVISTLRRSSVLVSFLVGAELFGDKNVWSKFLVLIGIIAGIILIVLGSSK